MERVLIIYPQGGEREMAISALKGAGFQVATAEDGETGLRKLYETRPDVVILADELNGQDLYPCIRYFPNVPIIVLGKGDELVRVKILEMGADIYLNTLVSPEELVARVHSLLRRYKPKRGNPRFDPETNQVELGGRRIELTPTEFRLFSCLELNKGKTVPYSRLISAVWGEQVSVDNLYLYVRRLRQKLGIDSAGPYRLLNYRGKGYCFCRTKEKGGGNYEQESKQSEH
jgi:DNA-binding response OmpR family regulator